MKNQPLHPRTAIINHKQKNLSKTAQHHALMWLAKHFPEAFDNKTYIRPLKIGIINDILQYADKAQTAGISKSKLREAVVIFTRRIDYLICLKAREMRINLSGEPTTQVSLEEAESAALKIKRRIEKSAKNARSVTPSKKTTQPYQKEIMSPEFPPPFSAQMQSSPTKPVTIKHKTARAFDPTAVARLKEKLGLAKKGEVST